MEDARNELDRLQEQLLQDAPIAEPTPEPSAIKTAPSRDDRVLIGLMITASVLCLGIIGVLSYWLSVLL